MGSTFGVDITLGLDYMFSKEFGVGLEVAYLAGRLSDIEVNVRNVSLGDNKENLAHFNFNFGLQNLNMYIKHLCLISLGKLIKFSSPVRT